MKPGVIGVPADERHQVPKAFVTLTDPADAPEDVTETLQEYVKSNLAKYKYPREVEVIDGMPKTSTGKVLRYELRKREGLVD